MRQHALRAVFIYKETFRGSTERAPTETKKLPLVVKQKKLNNLREKNGRFSQ